MSQTKRRPALVLAELRGDDLILCQITSQARPAADSVLLEISDFVNGGLNQISRIRPERVFTADESVVLYRAGRISDAKVREAVNPLVDVLVSS